MSQFQMGVPARHQRQSLMIENTTWDDWILDDFMLCVSSRTTLNQCIAWSTLSSWKFGKIKQKKVNLNTPKNGQQWLQKMIGHKLYNCLKALWFKSIAKPQHGMMMTTPHMLLIQHHAPKKLSHPSTCFSHDQHKLI